MTLQVVSLIRRSSRKQHRTENNRSWLSTCSQVIRPWLLKIQHGKPCHTFAKLDVPCLPCGLAKTNEIVSMFVLFFRLFYYFEDLAFFENGGTNFTPNQSKKMFFIMVMFRNNFSKQLGYFD